MDPSNFNNFQHLIFEELEQSEHSWGLGRYFEERANILRHYPQMIEEGRIYHLGLDIMVPAGFTLYAPLDATVYEIGKEEGVGNYGGYVILRHDLGNEPFYSFYGHLNSQHVIQKGDSLCAGDPFASIGQGHDSGGWFTHTHLQILTQKAVQKNLTHQGYISQKKLHEAPSLFPDPSLLFRY
ncbi:peptidoglycan DD-metalloendopeptidase family protein [Candidatus Peregrinibacteria bacterium]|nr:peptidoglycan DD-metalloendopeptidase family protein [Candidatus Peregrinibacteria bacterium]